MGGGSPGDGVVVALALQISAQLRELRLAPVVRKVRVATLGQWGAMVFLSDGLAGSAQQPADLGPVPALPAGTRDDTLLQPRQLVLGEAGESDEGRAWLFAQDVVDDPNQVVAYVQAPNVRVGCEGEPCVSAVDAPGQAADFSRMWMPQAEPRPMTWARPTFAPSIWRSPASPRR